MKFLTLLAFSLSLFILPAQAQPKTATAPGSHFSTSGGRVFWMGANYRKEWNTPVTVPVLDLSGMKFLKRGGGKQTKSLHLEDASGRRYKIRTIQKFITDKTLPGDLNSEAAADLVSDGVSASYPYASLSMQPLADAVGVPYGKVKLVYIPDDPALGEYQKDFGNILATYEEKMPDSVKKDYDTDEVAEKLEKDNDNTVDEKALLTARILDMFVMDLDRHEGQWSWGAWKNENGGKTYFPIPKDRDQAFYINQGFLPGIAKRKAFVPQLEGFKAKAHDIDRFNYAARNLDRFFLTRLSQADWQKAVDDFIPKMTDQVIENALAQQPPEIRALPHNQQIIDILKERRKYLAAEVMEYYKFISEIVTITGSDKNELFDITRNDDGSMRVQVYKVDKHGNQGHLMYDRLFDGKVTKEVRMFGFDGDDKFVIHGNNDKIKIRMIGGGGADVFQRSGGGNGSAYVYDKDNGENKLEGKFINRLSNDEDVNKFDRLSFHYKKLSPGLALGYNPDDGVLIGLTYKIVTHGFRKEPYKATHTFYASHALSTKSWNFRYDNEFKDVLGKGADILTDIDVNAPNFTTNFFGYGMNSIYDKSQPGKFRYYRARYNLTDATVVVRETLNKHLSISFGPTFQRYRLTPNDKFNMQRFITKTGMGVGQNGLDPATLYNTQFYFGGTVAVNLDTRDNQVNPSKGINWETKVRHLSGIKNSPYNVTQINSDFSFYIPIIKGWLTLANRVGGGTNVGNGFEFYQAQYLGNKYNLRGYRKNRFAGKSKLYNQAELRLKLANFRTYLFPAAFGIYGFYDIGRVWVENDTQKQTASGYGGGIWFSPLSRIMVTVGYGFSTEDNLITAGLGWKF